MDSCLRAHQLPSIIQGGMGVAVSQWRLAQAAARAGCLGVVSGTVIDRVVAYRLQEGDPDGHLRRVIARFPVPVVAQNVLRRWYVPGGVKNPGAYRSTAMIDHRPSVESLELMVVAAFAEVSLAKEGHDQRIGINLLEKIQTPNLALMYGAMLAGVDVVLMGAGIPREIPAALSRLARHEEASLALHVEGSSGGNGVRIVFDPKIIVPPSSLAPLARPLFLAIISSEVLAQSLLRSTEGQVDGFVVEGPTSGGHNAPPRGGGQRNARGEPVYGPRDEPDLERLRRLDRPFWLAGGYGVPGGLQRAQAAGAQGIQAGTAFAFCRESGLDPAIRTRVLARLGNGEASVFSDPLASPTGFPFKVVAVPDSMSEADVYAKRKRVCNLGYLRHAYQLPDGSLGWRCPAEPAASFIAKGGDPSALEGRKCLCNGLLASAGFSLALPDGGRELPLVTAGDALLALGESVDCLDRSAAEVVAWLQGERMGDLRQ